jgi:CHAT domain-containing protein/tetratricopeptide (TPR) repeat protein
VTVRTAPIVFVCVAALAAAIPVAGAWIDMSTTLDDCDARVAADREDLSGYQCYWFVGRNQARLDAAAHRLDRLLETDPTNHRARLYLGIVLADLGSDRAEGLLAQAAGEFAAESDVRGEVYARISLAMWLRHRGRTREASTELDRALEAAVGSEDAGLEAQVRVDLSWQKYNMADYGGAWRILRETEPLVFPDGTPELRLAALDALGAVSWALGRHADALEYYGREIEILDGGDAYRESGIRRNMALVARHLGPDRLTAGEIDQIFRDAVDAAVRAGNRYAEAGARVMLASALEGEEGLDEALRALDAARETRKLNDICWSLWLVGEKRLKLDPGAVEQAYAPVEEALDLARERASAELYAQGMLVRARMRWETGPRERAIADSLAALDAIERIRDLQPDGEVKARVMSRFASAYRWLQGMLLGSAERPGVEEIERAFAVSERLRARSLLDTLDAAGATERLLPSGPETERRSEVLGEIGNLRSTLARGGQSSDETERLLTRLAELERREAELREAIAENHERFGDLRGMSRPDLDEVRETLDTDQALVSFVIANPVPGERQPGGSWALVITTDDAVAVRLDVIEGLEKRIRLYVSLLGRRDGLEAEGGRRLYDYVMRGVVEALPGEVTSLILLPDGPLHRLPFGALVDGTGSFLAERFELTIVPSAATWLRWKRAPTPGSSGTLLGFADPSPVGLPEGADPPDLPPLPHARGEVEEMLRRLGDEGRILEGRSATETALENEDLSRYRVVHLAAHALVNLEHPERSAVLLGPDATDDGNDGVVEFNEVVDLALDGQVVLLSACRSASGPLIGGEGVMGLANAFFQAGARTVVASLWPVRDRETAALVNRFAVHLGDGRSVASALSLARRDLVRRDAPPASWAGMAVLGDGDVVLNADGDRSSIPWWVGSAFAVTLVAAIVLAVRLLIRSPL